MFQLLPNIPYFLNFSRTNPNRKVWGSKERFFRCPTPSPKPGHIGKAPCFFLCVGDARNNTDIQRRLSGYRPQSASYARSCSTTRLSYDCQRLRLSESRVHCALNPIQQEAPAFSALCRILVMSVGSSLTP